MAGRPFLQIPGPSIVPERVVRAMSQSLIDHRGPAFALLLREIVTGLKQVFQTTAGHILLFPGSGTGAWESCIVNTLSPGDRVLGCVNGYFSDQFCRIATAHGIEVQRLRIDPGRYRAYVARAEYDARYPSYYVGNFAEKSFEHFIVDELGAMGPGRTIIDIASEHSPLSEIASRPSLMATRTSVPRRLAPSTTSLDTRSGE